MMGQGNPGSEWNLPAQISGSPVRILTPTDLGTSGNIPVVPTASGAMFDRPIAQSGTADAQAQDTHVITDIRGVEPPHPTVPHVDLPNISGNPHNFPILHIPDPVPGNVGTLVTQTGGITHQNDHAGLHVDRIGEHGNRGPGPVIHRPDTGDHGGVHVDPIGVHNNFGPGPVIHRPDTGDHGGVHVDPIGVHNNFGPGPVIHRPGTGDHGGVHVDPIGVHNNRGPGPVIHRPDTGDHGGVHVDPIGVHNNRGPGPVIHRPDTGDHGGVHVDPIGVHNNRGPGPVIHRPDTDHGGVHVDPIGVHNNFGPGPVIHRPDTGDHGGVHVDPIGVHNNRGPGPVIHRPDTGDHGGVHVDPIGVHNNRGPGPVIHRPGTGDHGGVHVDPIGVHNNGGPGPVIHRPGTGDHVGVHVDPIGVHNNVGPGPVIHRPDTGDHGGVHVDPIGVHNNRGPGPVIHRPGTGDHGGVHVDPIGVHDNRGPGPVIHRPGTGDHGGVDVDPIGIHNNRGPGPVIHRPGTGDHGGVHVDPIGVHNNRGPGPVIHRPGTGDHGGTHVDPINHFDGFGQHDITGTKPVIDTTGPFVPTSDGITHQKPEYIDRSPSFGILDKILPSPPIKDRPIFEVPIGITHTKFPAHPVLPTSFPYPNKPKSRTPLVSMVKSMVDKMLGGVVGKRHNLPIKPIDPPIDYRKKLHDLRKFPDVSPHNDVGIVIPNSPFADIHLLPRKPPKFTKPNHVETLPDVVNLKKGEHIDFTGQHDSPFNGPAIHTKDGRHIPLDHSPNDPIGLHDHILPGDISKPGIDPFEFPTVIPPKHNIKLNKRRGRGKGNRRGKGRRWGKRWNPKKVAVIKHGHVDAKHGGINPDKIYPVKPKPEILQDLGHSAKGHLDKIKNKDYHGRTKPDIPSKIKDMVKPIKPIVKKEPKPKTFTIIHIPPRQVHPLEALRNVARQGIGAIMSGLLRNLGG